MRANQSVAARFDNAPVTRSLVVTNAGAGRGAVTTNPSGIDCGSTCSTSFADGALVSLVATPSPGSVFVGWQGGGCSGTAPCVLNMRANQSVTAHFEMQAWGVAIGVLQVPAVTITDVPAVSPDGFATTTVQFPVSLSETSAQTVTVEYRTVDGTARAKGNYLSTVGTLSFAPGETYKVIPVTLPPQCVSKTVNFFVNLSNPTNATLSSRHGTGTLTRQCPG
jgi:hypothetical protein